MLPVLPFSCSVEQCLCIADYTQQCCHVQQVSKIMYISLSCLFPLCCTHAASLHQAYQSADVTCFLSSPHAMWDESVTEVSHKFSIQTDSIRFQFLTPLLQSHSLLSCIDFRQIYLSSVFKYPNFLDSLSKTNLFLPKHNDKVK